MHHSSAIHPLVRKLQSIFPLGSDERQAVEGLPMQLQTLRADQDIVREGDRPTRCCLVLEGFTCTYKHTLGGKRQVMAFHVSGDMPDLQSLHIDALDNSIGTLTPCRVGFIRHEALHSLCDSYPRITAALWRDTLVNASIFREWILNIGRRDGVARVAHLLCEITTRMRAVGLAQGDTYELPMTQVELADAVSFSAVHVNRLLQDLRGSGHIALTGSSLTLLDWKGLKEIGGFEPSYLHLRAQQVAA